MEGLSERDFLEEVTRKIHHLFALHRSEKYLAVDEGLKDLIAELQTPRSKQGREVFLSLNYLPIDDLVKLIDEPYRSICKRILEDYRPLFEKARGSTHNHQTWDGGYIDHVTDGMNYARHLYAFDAVFGRPLPFTLSDALLVFFLHDLEKPWRILVRESGHVTNREGLVTKEEFKKFREEKLAEYGLVLTPPQQNAFTYIEGEYKDYSSECRVMNELAAFCHKVDTWCARGWYDYPKAEHDEWIGAGRFRTV